MTIVSKNVADGQKTRLSIKKKKKQILHVDEFSGVITRGSRGIGPLPRIKKKYISKD